MTFLLLIFLGPQTNPVKWNIIIWIYGRPQIYTVVETNLRHQLKPSDSKSVFVFHHTILNSNIFKYQTKTMAFGQRVNRLKGDLFCLERKD